MARGSQTNATQIWVAVITVVGGVLTAIIVNADKWISRDERPVAAASRTAGAQGRPDPAGPTSAAPTDGVPGDEPTAASRTAAATQDHQIKAAVPSSATTGIDLSGVWRDDDGSRFNFTQSGSQYEYTHTAINGTFQSIGRGAISGRDLSHTFETATGESGSCTARLNAGADRMTGNCLNAEGAWTFVIER